MCSIHSCWYCPAGGVKAACSVTGWWIYVEGLTEESETMPDKNPPRQSKPLQPGKTNKWHWMLRDVWAMWTQKQGIRKISRRGGVGGFCKLLRCIIRVRDCVPDHVGIYGARKPVPSRKITNKKTAQPQTYYGVCLPWGLHLTDVWPSSKGETHSTGQ